MEYELDYSVDMNQINILLFYNKLEQKHSLSTFHGEFLRQYAFFLPSKLGKREKNISYVYGTQSKPQAFQIEKNKKKKHEKINNFK